MTPHRCVRAQVRSKFSATSLHDRQPQRKIPERQCSAAFLGALLENAAALRRRSLCPASHDLPREIRLNELAACDSGHTVRADPVLSGRLTGRVAGATLFEGSCRILAHRVTGRVRGSDAVCRMVQPRRRIARPSYGGHRRSRSVSAPGRNPDVDPDILATFPKVRLAWGRTGRSALTTGCTSAGNGLVEFW